MIIRRVFLFVSVALFSLSTARGDPSPAPFRDKALAIYAPAPKVPIEAKVKHLKGVGVCVVYVRPDGTVSHAEMLRSTGEQILDKASVDAFSRWRFRSGTVNKVKIPITYTGKYSKPTAR
jgi:TonB family protein